MTKMIALVKNWTDKYVPPGGSPSNISEPWKLPEQDAILQDLCAFPTVIEPADFESELWRPKAAILNVQLMNLSEDPKYVRKWNQLDGPNKLFQKLIPFSKAIAASHLPKDMDEDERLTALRQYNAPLPEFLRIDNVRNLKYE